jgi:hypothetical protein
VTFIPATLGGKLTEQLREVLREEGRRLHLTIKAVETGGVSLKRKLTGGDLAAGEPCGQPDFLLQKPKSGFNTVRLPCGKPGICSDNSCGTHSLCFLKPEV